mmetsp:Transcript_5395/g.15983  ORF Transcript_5395/g.15983 Transcript_5395/m.15983 type:complete len:381 (+) Transcript_5395:1082-2224(+)
MRRYASAAVFCAATAAAMQLRVQTAVGSRFLDKKADLDVEDDATIADVKRLLEARFPGAPPASVQRLFFGSRLLRDDEAAASIAEDDEDEDEDDAGAAAAPQRVPVTLDVVPPVAAGRPRPPDDDEDRVKAYAAEVVALEAARSGFEAEFGDAAADAGAELRCAALARRVRRYEAALLETLEPQLAARRKKVTSGVVRSGKLDAADPRQLFFASKTPAALDERLALSLDLDYREAAKVAAGVFLAARVGVRDAGRRAFLLALLPVAFLAQTRPARFLAKVAWYALPRGPARANGFFDAFLNGPQQLILAFDEDAYVYELFRPLVVDDELAAADDDGTERGLRRDVDGDDDGWVAVGDDDENVDDAAGEDDDEEGDEDEDE